MCCTFSQTRCHHQVLSWSHIWVVLLIISALQTSFTLAFNIPASLIKSSTHLFQPYKRLLDWTGSYCTAAGHCNITKSVTDKQRSHYKHACTHFADQFIRCKTV